MNLTYGLLVCHTNRLLADSLKFLVTNSFSTTCRVVNTQAPVEDLDGLLGDVLLLDASLPKTKSTAIIAGVRRANPDCRVLLLVTSHSSHRVLEFPELGVDGCLYEDTSVAELSVAIQTVSSGEPYCSPQVANALFARNVPFAGHRWSKYLGDVQLTVREREVLQLIAWERLGNKQIARRLQISQYTVKNHVSNIIEKLGVEDRHEAAEVAAKRQLLLPAR